jgi:hypothetical protein
MPLSTAGTAGAVGAPEPPSASQADLGPLLLLLNDACMNDGNAKQLIGLRVLPHVAASLDGAGLDAAGGAVTLLCTAVSSEDVRKEVSAVLAARGGQGLAKLLHVASNPPPVLQVRPGGVPVVACRALSTCVQLRLNCMLACMRPSPCEPRLTGCVASATVCLRRQGLALAVLGNCLVDKPARAALAGVWRTQASVAEAFVSLLRPTSETGLILAEKAATLLGNGATDFLLRAEMLEGGGPGGRGRALVDALTAMAAPPAKGGEAQPGVELRRAAVTALFNLALDEPGQRLVAGGEAAEGAQAAGQPQPPLARLYGVVLAAVKAAPALSGDRVLVARAAGVVARGVRAPGGAALLLRLGGLAGMIAATQAALATLAAGSPAEQDVSAALLDAAVRTLAVLTASGDAAVMAQLAAAGAVDTLQRALRAASPALGGGAGALAPGAGPAHESVLANAALTLAALAARPELLAALRGADPVPDLVKVTHEGRGNQASKNAAICLARLSKHPDMLATLRELHGLEIMYSYVKPT